MTDPAPNGRAQPRIAILVLGCLLPAFERCIDVIRTTWGAHAIDGVDVFYVYGAQPTASGAALVPLEQLVDGPVPHLDDGEVWASRDVLLCGAADLFVDQPNCVLRKRLYAFGHLAVDRSYDFVHAVCASSYVDVAGLKRYVCDLPTWHGIYHGGLLVHEPTGYPFVSGASILLSRDIAGELGRRAPEILASYPESLPDDVVIGHVVASTRCAESLAEIGERIASGVKATANETFVVPNGWSSVDYVRADVESQVAQPQVFHYHFDSRRPSHLWRFHHRFFTA